MWYLYINSSCKFIKVINNNEIWLEDTKSQFGSDIIQSEPFEMTVNSGRWVFHIGRSLFTFEWKFPTKCWWFKKEPKIIGVKLMSNIDDFPLSLRELIDPKQILYTENKQVSEMNHECINGTDK